jgi:hypothetical protein
MYVPKPKVTIKEIQKQDFFWKKTGEQLELDTSLNTHHHFQKPAYAVTIPELQEIKRLVVRPRIYIAFELREAMRIEGKNKSKSRALAAVTVRQGDAVPKDFLRKVRAKLDSFGLSRSEQLAITNNVKEHLENVMTQHLLVRNS